MGLGDGEWLPGGWHRGVHGGGARLVGDGVAVVVAVRGRQDHQVVAALDGLVNLPAQAGECPPARPAAWQ